MKQKIVKSIKMGKAPVISRRIDECMMYATPLISFGKTSNKFMLAFLIGLN